MADLMEFLVINQKGYLEQKSARDGLGITVSYWKSLEEIQEWKSNSKHLIAQKFGQEK